MPNPNMGESRENFIQRYVSSAEAQRKYPDPHQCLAVAARIWEQYQNIKKSSPYAEEFLSLSPTFQGAFGTEAINITMEADSAEYFAKAHKDNTPPGTYQVEITKAVSDNQLVFGWANVSKDKNGNYPLDWDQDQIKPEDLEKAAYAYVLENEGTDELHDGPPVGHLIESVIFTKEKMASMGIPEGIIPEAWWVGFWVPNQEIFQKIKDGKYKMLSVGGQGYRVPIEEE